MQCTLKLLTSLLDGSTPSGVPLLSWSYEYFLLRSYLLSSDATLVTPAVT